MADSSSESDEYFEENVSISEEELAEPFVRVLPYRFGPRARE
jgi:hypothetical protein